MTSSVTSCVICAAHDNRWLCCWPVTKNLIGGVKIVPLWKPPFPSFISFVFYFPVFTFKLLNFISTLRSYLSARNQPHEVELRFCYKPLGCVGSPPTELEQHHPPKCRLTSVLLPCSRALPSSFTRVPNYMWPPSDNVQVFFRAVLCGTVSTTVLSPVQYGVLDAIHTIVFNEPRRTDQH